MTRRTKILLGLAISWLLIFVGGLVILVAPTLMLWRFGLVHVVMLGECAQVFGATPNELTLRALPFMLAGVATLFGGVHYRQKVISPV